MISRRNALTVLGLASAGPALAAEDFMADMPSPGKRHSVNGLPVGKDASHATVAKALRSLADEIERDGVSVHSLNVSTDIRADAIVVQKLSLDFVIPIDA